MPRTFVVGDIHGCYDELISLTQNIGLIDKDLLISVGDKIDRGNKSKDVYRYFLNRPNSVVLIGNHERKHSNNVLTYAQEIVKLQFGFEYQSFLDWLSTLAYAYETDDAIIVHAAFEHDKSLDEQREEVLSGTTSGERYLEKKYEPETFWNDYYVGEKPLIYGHHVIGEYPLIKNNTYGIDTGACHGGYLTAIELPGFIIHQVKCHQDHWQSERIVWQIPVLQAKDWLNMEFITIKRQLEKLSSVKDPATVNYLNGLGCWVKDLENLLPSIKIKIDVFTEELVTNQQQNFNSAASKFAFKTFIFKSRTNNLKPDDLQKSLNTPQKILDIAQQLGLSDLPVLQTG